MEGEGIFISRLFLNILLPRPSGRGKQIIKEPGFSPNKIQFKIILAKANSTQLNIPRLDS
jgi:hypothetical protein